MARRPINNSEATYQQIVAAWIDDEIAQAIRGMITGSALLKHDVTRIAMDYSSGVSRIRALEDVKQQMIEIEKQLMGQ